MSIDKFQAIIIINERDVVHDGYCSDADEDVGEEETRTVKVQLTKEEVEYMKENKIIDDFGNGDIIIARQKKFKKIIDFHKGTTYCNSGSGYCGYTGHSYIESFTIQKSIL
jgi:hypothetical protein